MASLGSIQEAFTGTSTPSGWTESDLGSALFAYDRTGATVNLPAATTSSTDGDIVTSTTNNLTGSFARINVLEVSGAGATHTDNVLRVRQNSTNYVTIFYEAGTLFFSKVVASSQTNIASIAYDSTNHAWWQIREKNGSTYWETSSDGFTWTTQVVQNNPITITAVDVLIGALCFGIDTTPSPFKFRYFNYPQPGTTTSTSSTSVSTTSTSISSTSSSTSSTSSSTSSTSTSLSTSSTSTSLSSTSSSISSTSSSTSSTSISSTSSSTSLSSTSSSISSTSQSSTSQSSTSSSTSKSSTSTSFSSTSSSVSSTSHSTSSTSFSSTSSSSSTSTTTVPPPYLTYSYKSNTNISGTGLATKIGTYLGTGNNLSIMGLGFTPSFLMIKGGSSITQVGTVDMGSSRMQDITGATPASLRLLSYDPDGFTIGNDPTVNTNGTTYYYLAVYDATGTNFTHGTYNGTAAGIRTITTGLQPDLIMVWDNLGDTGGFRTSDMATDSYMDYGGTTGILTDRITSIISTGFTVDFRNETNGSARNYYWVAFKKATNLFTTFTYTGNGTDGTSITGLGFQPDFALTNNGSITPAAAALRFKDESANNSFLANANGEGVTNIQTFISNGITVGTGTSANINGTTYYAIAFKQGVSATNLNLFNAVQYGNASGDDGDYFIEKGTQYLIQMYKDIHQNNTDIIIFTWKGRSTLSTLVSPIIFQIYNVNSTIWETLAIQNNVIADTDFTQTITQSTNLSNYYDTTNTVTFRSYQVVV